MATGGDGGMDWDEVTVLKKKAPKASEARSDKVVTQALRKGQDVETTKKFSAATNKQKVAAKDTAKLDRETEELKHERVSLDFSKALQQARSTKGMTQKDLATRINEKPQVVNDYEAGRAIPNQAVISKLERALGVKLRGRDIGSPLNPPGSKHK
jgi:putative transcription factor